MSDKFVDNYDRLEFHAKSLEKQLEEARADRDVYKRVIDGVGKYLKTGEIDETIAAKSTTFHEVIELNARITDLVGQLANSDAQAAYDALGLNGEDRCVEGVEGYAFVQHNAIRLNRERVAELEEKIATLEHQLVIEKGRPGCDSYRDDLLRMMCAMVSSFQPDQNFDPEKVAFVAGVAVDKAYAEAAKRR